MLKGLKRKINHYIIVLSLIEFGLALKHLRGMNMKRKILMAGVVLLTLCMFSGCTGDKGKTEETKSEAPGQTVNISAAASLTEALNEIQTLYNKNSKDSLQFNFGGSGSLQKQIQEGAPCDIFISAATKNMDNLAKESLIEEATRKDLLGNTLTLIASKEKADQVKLDTLTGEEIKSMAIGEVETVPAGSYGKQTLETMGIWEEVQSKLIFAKDVKQVLEYVDTGNVDCGFVYKSDALELKTGIVVADVPENDHEPIVYPAAMMKNAQEKEGAKNFYAFLETTEAKDVFEKYGFMVLE